MASLHRDMLQWLLPNHQPKTNFSATGNYLKNQNRMGKKNLQATPKQQLQVWHLRNEITGCILVQERTCKLIIVEYPSYETPVFFPCGQMKSSPWESHNGLKCSQPKMLNIILSTLQNSSRVTHQEQLQYFRNKAA